MRHTMRTRTAVTGAAVVLSLTVLGGGIAQARSGQNAGVPADQTSSQTTEPADTTEPAGPDTDTLQQGDQGTDGENEGVNDGPGGHQDPPGDVQNEGGPNEH